MFHVIAFISTEFQSFCAHFSSFLKIKFYIHCTLYHLHLWLCYCRFRGMIKYRDITDVVRKQGYWPSYNTAYVPELFQCVSLNFISEAVLFYSGFLPRCMECRCGLAMRIPSIRLSVRHTRELWQNGRKICLDFYTIRKIIYPSFTRKRIFGGGDPFYLKFGVNWPALERNRRFWTDNRS